MPKKTRLSQPRRIKIGGKPFWQVTAPSPEGGRIRKTFKEREDARIYHERTKVQLAQFGTAAMIDDRTRTDAARAAEVLAGTGKTLLDAARFLLEHIRRSEGGKPLADAVAEFLKFKKAERLSDRYLASLRHRLPASRGDAGYRHNCERHHGGYRRLLDQAAIVTGNSQHLPARHPHFFRVGQSTRAFIEQPGGEGGHVQESTRERLAS